MEKDKDKDRQRQECRRIKNDCQIQYCSTRGRVPMPSSIKIPKGGVDGGWMGGYPLDCYDYQSTCGPGGKHSYCSDFRWDIFIQNPKSKYCAWKKSSCSKIKGEVCVDFKFLVLDSSIVRWSQTIVNIRGVHKLHLPSDSCWKFSTHQV